MGGTHAKLALLIPLDIGTELDLKRIIQMIVMYFSVVAVIKLYLACLLTMQAVQEVPIQLLGEMSVRDQRS